MNKYDKQNKEFVDRGWQQMSLLLDEAMPVKKGYGIKKYLLLLLLLILVGVGAYFVVDNHNDKQQNIESKSAEYYAKNDIEKGNIDKNNKSEIVSSESETVSALSDIQTDIDENRNLSKTRQNKIQKENKNNQPRNYKNIKNTVDVTYNNQNLIVKNTAAEILKIKPIEKNIEDNKNDLFITTQDITTRQSFISSNVNPPDINRVFIAFVKKPCTDYLYEIDLSVVSENLKSIGGFEIGINRNFALTDNFYIGSGLQYSFYKKYRTNTSFFKTYSKSSDYNETDNGTEGGIENFNNNFRSPGVLSNFIDELHYLSIPVTVNYKTSKFIYSIGVRVSSMIYGKNYIADKQRLLDYNVIINSEDAFYDKGIFNKIDYSFALGVSYSLSKKLSISAKANYSYIGIINSGNISPRSSYQYMEARDIQFKGRFDKNVYLGLGIKYRFGKSCPF